MESGARRAGRPAGRVLTRQRITEATLNLLSSAGYDGLTMVALARRLGVAPSALYNHVESKRDVLVWVQDHLMALVDSSAFHSCPWDEALRQWAWSYRAVFSTHAPLVPIIAVLPIAGAPDTLRMYEEVAHGLLRAGWPEDQIVSTIVAVESFIYGSALDVSAPSNIFDSGLLADDFPVFTSAVSTNRAAHTDKDAADVAFNAGLEALITGLRSLVRDPTWSSTVQGAVTEGGVNDHTVDAQGRGRPDPVRSR